MIDLTKENIEYVLKHLIEVAKQKGSTCLKVAKDDFRELHLLHDLTVGVVFEEDNYYSDPKSWYWKIDELLTINEETSN